MSPTPAQQIADVISALASVIWPISILVLVVVFRAPIRRLIGETKRLKTAGLEVEFQEHAQEVLNELSDSGLRVEPLEPAEQRLLGGLSKTNPRLAINLAWSRVRDASSRAAAAVGISSHITVRRIERLRQKGLATDDIVDLARTLKAMESAVASKPDIDPPRDFVEAFIAAALSLSRWLDDSARNIRNVAASPYCQVLSSTVRRPTSTVRRPTSTVRRPTSTVRRPFLRTSLLDRRASSTLRSQIRQTSRVPVQRRGGATYLRTNPTP